MASSLPQWMVSRDHESLVAEGDYPGRFILNKSARNPIVNAATTPEDIWESGGVYTGFPTGAAEALRITSDSVEDAAAGTGARTVKIHGLNANFALIDETVTLNGTTPVVTTALFYRVYFVEVLTAGSAATNVGILTVRHNVTTANIFALCPVGVGQSHGANFTIPNGYTGYLKFYNASMYDATTNRAELAIWYRPFGGAVRLRSHMAITNTSSVSRHRYGGLILAEKSDFTMRCTLTSSNGADITATWDLECVRN